MPYGGYVPLKKMPFRFQATIICLLAALFYLYEFILQVSPNVISFDLMRDMQLQATGLGFLSASYFYAYMPVQFPAGLLHDRYGPRKMLTLMVIVCAIGALLFSQGENLFTITIGRAMMGFGSAFAFIGTLVLVSRWFPAAYFPIIAGIVQAMSSVGAIIGSVPLAEAVKAYGWRTSLFTLALVGFGLAVLIGAIVRDSPKGRMQVKHHNRGGQWRRLLTVCKCSQSWLIALYAFTMWAPITIFAELWGVAYLRQVYHYDVVLASSFITFIWIGIAVGSPSLGFFSQIIKRRCLPLYLMASLGLVASLSIIYPPFKLSSQWMCVCMFMLGLSASGCILTFSLVKENNAPGTVGSAIGLNNMMVVAGGAVLQPLVGVILKSRWNGLMVDSAPVYSASAYQLGLLTIPVCYTVALILALFAIRETNCRSRVRSS